MRSVISFAALALAAGALVPRFAMPTNRAAPPPAMMAAQPVTHAATISSDSRSVTIGRGPNGHFEVEGRVDGRRIGFMVDTGASVIALTEHDAAMLGIHPAERDYVGLVRTANGTARAAPVRLDMVEIEDLVVHDVDAVVMPNSALSDNLLGLSFLSRLRRFEYSEGRLVLEQ